MTPQMKNTDDESRSAAYDPFPQPRTIPTGWDLSDYVKDESNFAEWTTPNPAEGGSTYEA